MYSTEGVRYMQHENTCLGQKGLLLQLRGQLSILATPLALLLHGFLVASAAIDLSRRDGWVGGTRKEVFFFFAGPHQGPTRVPA